MPCTSIARESRPRPAFVRAVASLCAAGVVAACANPRPYREPATGDDARVTLTGAGVRFEAIDTDRCPAIVRHELSLPIPTVDGVTRVVPAGRRWVVTAHGPVEGRSCTAAASFVPQADRHYELRMIGLRDGACVIAAEELVEARGTATIRQPRPLQVVDGLAGYCAWRCDGRSDIADPLACVSKPR